MSKLSHEREHVEMVGVVSATRVKSGAGSGTTLWVRVAPMRLGDLVTSVLLRLMSVRMMCRLVHLFLRKHEINRCSCCVQKGALKITSPWPRNVDESASKNNALKLSRQVFRSVKG